MTLTSQYGSKYSILGLAAAISGLSAFSGEASALTLDFTTSTGGTVLDAAGLGTGFTSRLTNTVQSGVASTADARLTLNTGAGTLSLSGSPAGQDFSGQGNVGGIEAPGLQLSSLGFTGTQDFTATAVFTNVPAAAFANYSQFGIYVGTSTTNLTRAEFIFGFGGNSGSFLGTNTNGNNDSAGNNANQGGFTAGGTVTATISRTGGVFTETVNGFNVTPNTAPATFLAASDFTVGAFVLNTDGGNSYTVPLDSFTANVVPEPSTWIMLVTGAGLFLGVQRFRSRKASV